MILLTYRKSSVGAAFGWDGLIMLQVLVWYLLYFIDEAERDISIITIKPVYKWYQPFMQISGSDFTENFAKLHGGAIMIEAESGSIGDYSSMIISQTSFYKNNASDGFGGAIYKSSAVDDLMQDVMSTLIFENIANMMSNEAGYGGGAISIYSPDYTNLWRTAALINNIDFEENIAISYGGAIFS